MRSAASSFLTRGRLSRPLMVAFICIIAALAAVVMVIVGRITAQSLEARAQSQLASDEAIVRMHFAELEENIVFLNELLANTQMLTEEATEPAVSRSLLISLLADLKHRGMSAHAYKRELVNDQPNSLLIQKGFLGIRTIGLGGGPTEGGWAPWLVSVSPIESKKEIEQVVSVTFPLTVGHLKSIAARIGSDLTLVLPTGQTLSTLAERESTALLRQLGERGIRLETVEESMVFPTTSTRGPSSSLVGPFTINFRKEGLLVLTMPMADLLAAKKRIVSKGLLATLVLLAWASLVYLSLIRKITKPLDELSAATREVARGRLDLQVSVASQDEVGELASSFNTMVERLRESRAEIEGWNRTLENRVEERTRSLEVAKTDLKAANEQLLRALEELKTTQGQMIRTEKLAALGQMASTIAHEVQNPLVGMRGALEILLGEAGGGERAEVLKLVIEQIDRLSETTTRLLRFARPSTPHQAPADLTDLVAKTRLLVQEQARARGVTIALNLEPVDRVFLMDPQLTVQAFLNIALNAVQAMSQGGTLTISTRWLREERELVVTFEDTGEGMSAEVRQKVFTPFFTTKHQGTGLGLYVVKDIIEQQGGTVEVTSVEGRGTAFTVRLPAREGLRQPTVAA